MARDERRLLMLVRGGVLFALAVAVILLRLQRLSELGPGLLNDEAQHGVSALQVLRGEHAVFFPEKTGGQEGLMAYAVALTTSILGRTMLAVRLPAALASAGTVFVVFWLGQLLLGRDESGQVTPWRGLLVGGVGAGLLAVCHKSDVHRAHGVQSQPPAIFSCPVPGAALVGLGASDAPRRSLVVDRAGGRHAQGCCRTPILPRVLTPLLFLLFGLSLVLPFGSVSKERVRAELPWVGVFLGVAGLVAAPLLVYFVLHPDHFSIRSSQLLVFDPTISKGGTLGAFLGNVWEHLLVFGFRGDPYWRRNFDSQPMLNPWEAFFFWLGVGMAALALAAARLSSLASLAGRDDPAGNVGERYRPQHDTHDRSCAGYLSARGCRRVGSFPIFAGAIFSERCY